jgi:hypothetical protein
MSITGHVHNGVVVLDDAVCLPEGTYVQVQPVAAFIQPDAHGWDAAIQAASELQNYDFDAWSKQRECDLHHAADHAP